MRVEGIEIILGMGYVDAQAGDALRTAFRRAEKRYKRYKQHASSVSSRGVKHRDSVPPTNLCEVLDFQAIKNLSDSEECQKKGIQRLEGLDWPVFTMEAHPGFYFIPEALNEEQQVHWIKESLVDFPQPPNRTNHTAIHGHIFDLWSRAQNAEVLVCTEKKSSSCDGYSNEELEASVTMHRISASAACLDQVRPTAYVSNNETDGSSGEYLVCHSGKPALNEKSSCNMNFVGGESVPFKTLLRKLRWVTLGLQFDWSKRTYDLSLPYRKIPPDLGELARKLAKPAVVDGDLFRAEAAIVNYFKCDDMLGGHLDDMEADWSKPIISISFGCKAIFLLGGKTREQEPTAMFLRSGDVVLMAGPARECFHGVPRIFVDDSESDVPNFASLDAQFLAYIRTSRINLNIRQVF